MAARNTIMHMAKLPVQSSNGDPRAERDMQPCFPSLSFVFRLNRWLICSKIYRSSSRRRSLETTATSSSPMIAPISPRSLLCGYRGTAASASLSSLTV
eukprot:8129082-Pyramimonas_sp.AAC.1